MELGRKFASYEALKVAIEEYQNATFTQFWIYSSRTISGAKRKGMKRHIEENLVYTEICYACVHGGRKYTSKSTGVRPKQKTFKLGCTARIKVSTTADGRFLEIRALDDEHNHPVSEACYKQLPKQRRLTEEQLYEVRKPTKNIISRPVHCGEGDLLTDLRNMTTSMVPGGKEESCLSAMAAQIESNGGMMDVLATDQGHMVGVFYQDQQMRHMFASFPEIVFVNAIHGTNGRRTPLYIVTVVDSNCEAEVVAFLLCAGEDQGTLRALFERFVFHCGPDTEKTTTMVADRDIVEREVLRTAFPNAMPVVCLFDVLRTFRREITVDGMSITAPVRCCVLEILESICYARDEEHYARLLQSLDGTGCANVIAYYYVNWHKVRSRWVQGMQQSAPMGTKANSRVESVTQKLAKVVSRYESLHRFFEDLMTVVNTLRSERNQQMLGCLLKASSYPSLTRIEEKFCQLLTPFAHEIVAKQLLEAQAMLSVEEVLTVFCDSCSCWMARSLRLPCKHIFFLRRESGLPLFFMGAVGNRWTKDYYQQKCQLFATDEVAKHTAASRAAVLESEQGGGRVQSETSKYCRASALLLQLASSVSKLPTHKYEAAMSAIKRLKDSIEGHTESNVVDSDKEECNYRFEEDSQEAEKIRSDVGDQDKAVAEEQDADTQVTVTYITLTNGQSSDLSAPTEDSTSTIQGVNIDVGLSSDKSSVLSEHESIVTGPAITVELASSNEECRAPIAIEEDTSFAVEVLSMDVNT